MIRAAIIGVVVLIAVLSACGGSDDEVTTLTAAPPPATTQATSRVEPLERRLTRAGYYVVQNPDSTRQRLSLTTGVGRMIVYIVGFRRSSDAAAYARSVAETARKAPRHVVARRVRTNVYSAVAAEGPDAEATPGPLLELIRDAEGRRARPVRLGPR
jgi:hypothetical protein